MKNNLLIKFFSIICAIFIFTNKFSYVSAVNYNKIYGFKNTSLSSENIRTAAGMSNKSAPEIIGNVIKVILGLTGTIALIFVIYGGVKWMVSKGDPGKIADARKLMTAGMIGLVIIVSAYAISDFVIKQLTTIAPESPSGGSTINNSDDDDDDGNISENGDGGTTQNGGGGSTINGGNGNGDNNSTENENQNQDSTITVDYLESLANEEENNKIIHITFEKNLLKRSPEYTEYYDTLYFAYFNAIGLEEDDLEQLNLETFALKSNGELQRLRPNSAISFYFNILPNDNTPTTFRGYQDYIEENPDITALFFAFKNKSDNKYIEVHKINIQNMYNNENTREFVYYNDSDYDGCVFLNNLSDIVNREYMYYYNNTVSNYYLPDTNNGINNIQVSGKQVGITLKDDPKLYTYNNSYLDTTAFNLYAYICEGDTLKAKIIDNNTEYHKGVNNVFQLVANSDNTIRDSLESGKTYNLILQVIENVEHNAYITIKKSLSY